jgi:hypothetical protein
LLVAKLVTVTPVPVYESPSTTTPGGATSEFENVYAKGVAIVNEL